MGMLEHAMIISLWKKWQDKKFIYLLTEICTGGELFMEIKKSKGFKEDRARFYAACTVSMLIELRKKEVVFRDLKPENILISGDGYLKADRFRLWQGPWKEQEDILPLWDPGLRGPRDSVESGVQPRGRHLGPGCFGLRNGRE